MTMMTMRLGSKRRGLATRGLCITLAFCVPLSGCGAILFRTTTDVGVTCTNVPNALFVANPHGTGVLLSVATPTGISARSGGALSLDRRDDYTILVKAPGYVTQEVQIGGELSIWRAATSIVLNSWFGLAIIALYIPTVIGVGIDIKAGAWLCLEPTPIEVELVPDGGGTIATSAPTTPAPPPAPAQAAPRAEPTLPPAGQRSRFCTSCGATLGTTQFCTGCGARAQ